MELSIAQPELLELELDTERLELLELELLADSVVSARLVDASVGQEKVFIALVILLGLIEQSLQVRKLKKTIAEAVFIFQISQPFDADHLPEFNPS